MTTSDALQNQSAPTLRLELSHLRQLEAESIQIMCEVAARFDRPVMLSSTGKDSGVMLHLARKAFSPEAIPLPLLHFDTTWKFRDTIRFRDGVPGKYDAALGGECRRAQTGSIEEKKKEGYFWPSACSRRPSPVRLPPESQ